MSWKAVFENPTKTSSLRLRDRVSGNFIYLTLRDGVVVGAMGADPSRYVGLTEQQARHRARFSQRGDNPRYEDRRYRVVVVPMSGTRFPDGRTKVVMAPGPLTHKQAVTILSRITDYPWRRKMVEEIT